MDAKTTAGDALYYSVDAYILLQLMLQYTIAADGAFARASDMRVDVLGSYAAKSITGTMVQIPVEVRARR
jgi:hypothetical protein